MVVFALFFVTMEPGFAQSRAATQGNLLSTFLQEYPKKEAELESSYSQVRIKADREKGEDVTGKIEIAETYDLLVKDGRFRIDCTCVNSMRSDWPVGSKFVAGGDAKLFYSAMRKPGAKDFVFLGYGKSNTFVTKLRSSFGSAVCAPFCVTDLSVNEILASKQFKAKSASAISVDGRDAVVVDFDCVDKSIPTKALKLTFDSSTMCLIVSECIFEKIKLVERCWYTPNTTPLQLATLSRWAESIPDGKVSGFTRSTITAMQFGPVKDDELTPAAAGLTELPVPVDEDKMRD